jgi:exodeoxyribonuclease-5
VAYDKIMAWVAASDQDILTLGGYAGSGKSTLISLVAESVGLPAFCAYTGKASSVLRRKLAAAGTPTVEAQRRGPEGLPSLERRPYCGTIHGLIYRPCSCREPQAVPIRKPCPTPECGEELHWTPGVEAGETVEAVCTVKHRHAMDAKKFEAIKPRTKFVHAKKGPDGRCLLCGGEGWLRREMLDRDYGLIIVDEASMVTDHMLRDLRAYGVPILAVGDHGQLPPVGGAGSLMRNPSLRLEQIHRQAAGNPIIALSKIIRETGRLPDKFDGGEAVTFGRLRDFDRIIESRYADASPARLLEMGIVVATNKRRLTANLSVRRERGTARHGRELPQAGEHVVCLKNMKGVGTMPVSNGMRGVLTSNAVPKLIKDPHGEFQNELGERCRDGHHLTASVVFPEDEIEERSYEMLRAQFQRDTTFGTVEDLERETGLHSFSSAGALFDFGWAMTCHKMQGSQVDDLIVVSEYMGWMSAEDQQRWLYTAVTRAAKKLTVLR